jgi:enoyl-CoA hydratase/carnithine racemase
VPDSPLLVERVEDGVVLLTLNLPERRNAMTEALTAAWTETMAQLRDDSSVRAVVVTGAGTVFCAGGDLSWITGDAPENVTPDRLRAKMYPFYRAWLAVRDLPVPVIGAINGAAVGAGLCLALACDLRYAGPKARFSAPFTTLGMHPGMAATWLIPEAVGMPRAREILYAGRIVHAEEAVTWGLASAVADDVVAHALEVAHGIAATAPVAVRLTKAALAHPYRPFAEALEWEAVAQPITMATDDLREGMAAAGERRPPRFTGP